MSRHFTIDEARSLIPEVERLIRDAVALKPEYDEAEREFQRFTERVMMVGGMLVDREQAFALRNRRESAATRLRNALETLQGMGCMVKDLDMGLVDFPTLFRGEEVLLCWKLGETDIAFWHGMEEGFRGRKAIDEDFRRHHQGGEKD
jgi:hypothetical protein